MSLRRVVVTGMGALTPVGNTLESFWQALLTGTSGAAPIPYFDTTHFKTKFACILKDIDISHHIERKELRRLDRFSQYGLIAAKEAINDAEIEKIGLDNTRIGVIWGSGIGGIGVFEEQVGSFYSKGKIPKFNPFFIPKMIIDILPGHISMKYGFKGPNFSTVAACASSSQAIIDAYNYIRIGKADMFVTGGSEAAITEGGIGGFNAMKALSTRNNAPLSASRPFDVDRDGFVMGEGAGALIVEEYQHAKSRGAHIYAEIVGGGMTADAYHLTAPDPEGEGAKNVMLEALKDNQLDPSEVDYINVHGTSTPLGDIAELHAIKKAFGKHAYKLNISATKSMTGHLLGAAGAIEAIATIKTIQENHIPPTINNICLDPQIDSRLNLTLNTSEKRKIDCAISNTFGFGGHNMSIAFRAV